MVALKVLRPKLAAFRGGQRFLREIMLAARLQHPHIVPVYDSGEIAATGTAEPLDPVVHHAVDRRRVAARSAPSPDGRRVVFDRAAPRGADLWTLEGF
jgi:hypothetical protein